MDKKEAKKELNGIDIKFFLNGSLEQSNYIIDKADKVNIALRIVLQELDNSISKDKIKKKIEKIQKKLKNKNLSWQDYAKYLGADEVLQELLKEE